MWTGAHSAFSPDLVLQYIVYIMELGRSGGDVGMVPRERFFSVLGG